MDNLHMNRNLGTKWFTFYTKVRPWLACIGTLNVVSDFLQYVEVYTSYWWMMLYFAASVAQAVLSIMVFAKSRGDYIDFVRFVKKVLLFETMSMAYGQGVQQYIQNGFELGVAFGFCAITLLIVHFTWYRLNLKYFNKRILPTSYVTDTYEEVSDTEQDNTTESTKTVYCRKCGNKLLDEAKFCDKCGTEIIEVATLSVERNGN